MMVTHLVPLDRTDEKGRATFRRLLLAKQLYLHGIDHSARSGAMNKMIALHNLHNAVEIVLRAIFLHYEIRAEKELNIGFESMLNEIDRDSHFRSHGIKLPYRQEMRNLNQVRNLVQHHATEPASSTTEEARVFTRRFLERAYSTYFDCDFDTVSSVEMVEDEHLRQLLELAQLEIQKANLKKALTLIEAAFNWASAAIGEFLPKEGNYLDYFDELRDFAEVLGDIFGELQSPTEPRSPLGPMGAYKELGQRLSRFEQHLSDALKYVLTRSSYYTALFSSGVDFVEYRRFNECTVITRFSGSTKISSTGTTTTRRITAHWGDKEPSMEDARWAHEFAINAIVRWQIQGLCPRVSDNYTGEAQRLLAWGDDVILD
jgi:hypothetical protein